MTAHARARRPATIRTAQSNISFNMYVLGIDAGGTKTVCYLADAEGASSARAAAAAPISKRTASSKSKRCCTRSSRRRIGDRAVHPGRGLSRGGRRRSRRRRPDRARHHAAPRLSARTRWSSTTRLWRLVAGVGDEPGVVLIAGTGSIAYGVNHDGFAARAGGWGYVLGDEGSGYWIGRQALAAVVREADGRGPKTL